ncbi:MAG: hypothetical protein J6J36_00075 [Clostridia bacterium]|nr:hypothetical protein [Clostridia bacterium]
MNKVLIDLYVPAINKKYDIWIPITRKVGEVINLIIQGINSLNKVNLDFEKKVYLYNRLTAERYNNSMRIIDTDIRNATDLILM